MLYEAGTTPQDLELHPDLAAAPAELQVTADLGIEYPQGLAPVPQPFDQPPSTDDPLPRADAVVLTWTSDELDALADVLTPGFGRLRWVRYTRKFESDYRARIRKGAPALDAGRLGSYMMTSIGGMKVLCMKSELHLNQDGIKTGDGTATLPVKDFIKQIIDEVRPSTFITAGTAGSVFEQFPLGDVVVTRSAKFKCSKEFRNEAFNGTQYKSEWQVPEKHFAHATTRMGRFADKLTEPPLGPPSKRYAWTGPLIAPPRNEPKIRLEQGGRDMPEFHPILTTDYFEYGTSTNGLEEQGSGVEMGDAVLGLVASEMDSPPNWLVVRNMSDPQINGDLPTREFRLNPQTMWAVAFYQQYGYWTSVNGALATWAVLAGLAES
jgi:hypothetical protein